MLKTYIPTNQEVMETAWSALQSRRSRESEEAFGAPLDRLAQLRDLRGCLETRSI